jgi:hypothetical protein
MAQTRAATATAAQAVEEPIEIDLDA